MRWLRRLLVAAVALAAVTALTVWLLLRGSLAELQGERPLAGLAAAVQVQRDAVGAVTVVAGSEADAVRALGFVHAQERYFEMDLMRRAAAGELAALFGEPALALDSERRVHRLRARGRTLIASEPDGRRALLAAYAEGVNAGLAALAVRPWPYLLLGRAPSPWAPEDSALVLYAMFIDLQDETNAREFSLWRMRQALAPELYALLVPAGTEWDAPLFGDPIALPPLPARVVTPREGARMLRLVESPVVGSNNFAVAGDLTADGRALVANDMHLGLRVPNIWFRLRLRYPGPAGPVDVSGVSLPGTPGVVAGSNGHVAWGYTNSYGDWHDFVRVHYADPARSHYLTVDGEQAVLEHAERIEVAGSHDRIQTVRETRWGPILHELEDGSALALAWTPHRPGGANFALAELQSARTLEQALAVANRAGMPAQNLVVGDTGGRIGWTLAGRIPRRVGGCDPMQPLDPMAGCDWDGWIDPESAPRLLDPVHGRLWTANSRVVQGQALAQIGDGGYDLGARSRQIRDALFAATHFDEPALLAIQLDDRALLLERWWRLLRRTLRNAGPDPALAELEALTRRFSGRAAHGSIDYRLVRAFRLYVHEVVLDALAAGAREALPEGALPRLPQAEGPVWAIVQQRPAALLPADAADWDTVLLTAARRVVDDLGAQPGGLAARTWGERNTAAIAHPLSAALPAWLSAALDMPREPLPGDANMPRVQSPGFGASERFVVAPGREADGLLHMPGGQSGHPLSPFHGAGHAAWVQGTPTSFLPGPPRYTLTLTAP
ncbi:MAG TPA: penicillin acylase family protein [Xanthomonadaceae bacterium]|nr:penicillin acylase family protein [Xanthomonadaceae bacterium]